MGELVSWTPCPSTQRAYLGAVDAPEGVLLRCGFVEGHSGDHRFAVSWRDPDNDARGSVADEVQRYLQSRRDDPEFMRRLHERMERDKEILRRLAENDGPSTDDADGTQ